MLYCIVLYCILFYCIVLYCIVLYCIVLYCIVLYCTSETEIYSNYTHTTPTDHYAQSTKQRRFEEIISIFSSSSRPRIGPTYYTLPSGGLLSVGAAAENRYWKSDLTSAEQAPAVVPVSTLSDCSVAARHCYRRLR